MTGPAGHQPQQRLRPGRGRRPGTVAGALRLLLACGAALAMAACSATPATSGPSGGTTTASRHDASPGGVGGSGADGSGGPLTGTPTQTAPGVTATSSPPSATGFTRLTSRVGTLLATTLAGPKSGVRMRVWVWLPPQYGQPAYAHTQFPAVMLYPGGSGAGYNTWAGTQYGAQQLVAQASVPGATPTPGTPGSPGTTTGPVSPMVFVMPEMQLSEKLDTECADLPGQPKVGTFLADDVRDLVLRSFRVPADRRYWAAAGASSGAYCASRLVFDHPEQYAAVVSIDGYFHIETNLPGANTPAIRDRDPDRIAVTRPPDIAVLLWVGGASKVDVKDTADFLALLRPPTRGTLRTLDGGRHLTKDFARMMPDVFTWLSAQLARPVPA